MIAMLDTSQSLTVCQGELGCPVEQLFTPLTRYLPQDPEGHYGIDNGMFSRCNIAAFERLLAKHWDRRHLCRFVACPDVVASARRTLEAFGYWEEKLAGWPKALVAQDGLENFDIPWGRIEAVFIGGSTEWKMSKHAADVIHTAKICGKWVHAGRVNTPGRFEYFEGLGVDSIDGTGLSRYSWMRERIYRAVHEPGLFTVESETNSISRLKLLLMGESGARSWAATWGDYDARRRNQTCRSK